jgi:hypothetical protein
MAELVYRVRLEIESTPVPEVRILFNPITYTHNLALNVTILLRNAKVLQ